MPTGNYGFNDTSLTYFLDNYILHPNKTSLDGMPYTVLKPDNDSENIYGLNSISNQSGVNKIFVLKYNYKLTSNLTLPANSILKFEGGKIYCESGSSFTLTGNNTKIIAPPNIPIFDTSVNIAGTWDNPYSYPEWFGATGDSTVSNLNVMITNASKVGRILVLTQPYYIRYNEWVDAPANPASAGELYNIKMYCNKVIQYKNGLIIIDATGAQGPLTLGGSADLEKIVVMSFSGFSSVVIDGLNIKYTNVDFTQWTGKLNGTVAISDCSGTIKITNCVVLGGFTSAFNIHGRESRIYFENNTISEADCGIILQSGSAKKQVDYVSIRNNYFYKRKSLNSEPISFFTLNTDGLNSADKYVNVLIENNFFWYPEKIPVDGNGNMICKEWSRGSAIGLSRGTFISVTLKGNVYLYPGSIALGLDPIIEAQLLGVDPSTIPLSTLIDHLSILDEKIERTNLFWMNENNPSENGFDSGYHIYHCANVNISNSLISRIDSINSNITITNTEFCQGLEWDYVYNLDPNVVNNFFNYAFVTAKNSKINLSKCHFSLDIDGHMFTTVTSNLYRNDGGSLASFKDITINIPRWWPGDLLDYNVLNTRVGKSNGGSLTPIVTADPYLAFIGDHVITTVNSVTSLLLVDETFMLNNCRKLHIVISGDITKDGLLTFTFKDSNLNILYILRLVVKTPSLTSYYADPITGYDTIYAAFYNNMSCRIWEYENLNLLVVRLPFDAASVDVDMGGSEGMTITTIFNDSISPIE